MEMRIGETFEFKGKTYVTQEGKSCKGCAFEDENCSTKIHADFIGECCQSERTDHKPVIFVEVDEEGEDRSPAIEEGSRKETKSILEEALEIVKGSRNVDYGDPVESFKRIAQVANLIGKRSDFEPVDCCNVLIATKLVCESKGHKRDNLTDLAGYSHIKNLILESE